MIGNIDAITRGHGGSSAWIPQSWNGWMWGTGKGGVGAWLLGLRRACFFLPCLLFLLLRNEGNWANTWQFCETYVVRMKPFPHFDRISEYYFYWKIFWILILFSTDNFLIRMTIRILKRILKIVTRKIKIWRLKLVNNLENILNGD